MNVFLHLRAVPRPYLILGAVMVAAVLAGHFVNQERYLFPFVKWDMFTIHWQPKETVFFEYYGIRTDGTTKRLNLTHLYPSMTKQIPIGMEQVSEEFVIANPQAHADLIRVLGNRYNLLQPSDPIMGIAVVRGVVICKNGIPNVSRTSVQKVRLADAPAR